MTTQDDVVQNIKHWMKLDKEMKILQKELKTRREEKKQVSAKLVDIMKDNEIDSFDISEGKIIHTKNKVKAPLSRQHLLTALNTYFAENPGIEPADVGEYILNSRAVKVKDDIRHKPPKNI